MFAGEFEARRSVSRVQMLESCRMQVGNFGKLHFASSESGGLRRFGRVRNTTKDCLRPSDLFSKSRDRRILTYLSQKVVEGRTHGSKRQRLEGKEHQDSREVNIL